MQNEWFDDVASDGHRVAGLLGKQQQSCLKMMEKQDLPLSANRSESSPLS